MSNDVAGPDGSGLSEGLGLAPERDLVERLRAGCTDWDGSQMAAETQPMDCLTAGDVREAADEIERLRAEVANLREGLRWYAEGSHFMMAVQDAWDTVSGEPQNWWGDEAGTAMVEDGRHAKLVLAGELTGAQLHAPED